jgi:SAM-dependent methyltransferase
VQFVAEKLEDVACALCQSQEFELLLHLDGGSFDGSCLSQDIRVYLCKECGHIYNALTKKEYEGLLDYYDNEYAPTNIGASSMGGDRPGSQSDNTRKRHAELYELFKEDVSYEERILDVGCAMGGMLWYLKEQGFSKLCGIDMTQTYVDAAKQNPDIEIKLGSAESIPYEDESFDIVIIDQVLEHLIDPKKSFDEISRVLKRGGKLCVGIPDATKYNEYYFFDFFWFLMKEHIQHFDRVHLESFAKLSGLSLQNVSYSTASMMSDAMILPNINALFTNTKQKHNFETTPKHYELAQEMRRYLANQHLLLAERKAFFQEMQANEKPLYIWGIGREFLYLYNNTELKNCKIQMLVDANSYKQKNNTHKAQKIQDPKDLEMHESGVIIITALAHVAKIEQSLKERGFEKNLVALNQALRSCPVCAKKKYTYLCSVKLANFDGFELLNRVRVSACKHCGFLLNERVLGGELERFYTQESQYGSESSFGTGGVSQGDRDRYDIYANLIASYVPKDAKICDIGCAKGGLLLHLNSLGYSEVMGVELHPDLVAYATTMGVHATIGDAENLPFAPKSVDVLIYSHVFEHLLDFDAVMHEILRVLKDDGILFIEVPNSMEYSKHRVFDLFWLGIREHINHFSKESLADLLGKYTFVSLESFETHIAYSNEKYAYPSLMGVFQKGQCSYEKKEFVNFRAHQSMLEYYNSDVAKLLKRVAKVKEILQSAQKVVFWGIGAEFFIINSFFDISKYASKIVLVDKDTTKQKRSFKSLAIQAPEILETMQEERDVHVILCSVFHSEIMREMLPKSMQITAIHEL